MKFLFKYRILLASVLISFFSVISLLRPGLPPTHDGEYHVLRFEQFFKAINEGTLYPRWAADFNNGYGVPLFNYVYPLPNYVASFTHLLGFSFIESFKLNMILATLVGSVFFYLWTKKYWGEIGGAVSSVFYAFSPYHLLDIYVRGSVGEVWGLGLAPGLFWSYLNFYESKKIKYFVLASVFLSFLIFAHNILAVVFFTFFILYASFLIISKKSTLNNKIKDSISVFAVTFFGLGISCIFWFPAILETKYVTGLQIFDPTQHFPVIYKLIYSSWGYGFSGQNVTDQMSFQIGLANILIMVISCLIFIFRKRSSIVIFFILLFSVVLFLITPFSKLVWQNLPLISYVQFPWRLLSVLILISSFLAGSLVSNNLIKDNRRKKLLGFLLIVLTIVLSFKYIKAPFHHERNDEYYFSRKNFTNGTNSPGNVFNTVWFNPKLEPSNAMFTSNEFEINQVLDTTTKKKALVKGDKAGEILIKVAYFPGWSASIDGISHPVRVNKNGLFDLYIPKGEHELEVVLKSTSLQTLSLITTILSMLVLFGLFMWDKYIKIKK